MSPRPSDLIRRLADERGLLVTAHRGTPIASAGQNTLLAARGALASGADIVEIDATVSADGVVYAFHDGCESEALGVAENLATLDSAVIDGFAHRGSHCDRPARVPRLVDVLGPLRGTGAVVNLDRSWFWWPRVLDELVTLEMAEQVLIKFPANRPELAQVLAAHPVELPVMAICRSREEIEWAAGVPGLDLCAIELIADEPAHELAQPSAVARVHELGLLAFVNCEVLPSGPPLFAGWDDEQALNDPASGQPWQRLAELGIDIVQTDWPWLAAGWRDRGVHAHYLCSCEGCNARNCTNSERLSGVGVR